MSYRILSAEIAHETNTFSCIATDQQAFRDCFYLQGDEALAQRQQANTELAGFVDVAKKYHWELHHLHSAGRVAELHCAAGRRRNSTLPGS